MYDLSPDLASGLPSLSSDRACRWWARDRSQRWTMQSVHCRRHDFRIGILAANRAHPGFEFEHQAVAILVLGRCDTLAFAGRGLDLPTALLGWPKSPTLGPGQCDTEQAMRAIQGVILFIGLIAFGPLLASDLAKEKRWAEQIVDALLDGEAVELNDGRTDFLAIETASTDVDSRRAAVVVHGTGVHPNWPTVVLPLRVDLTQDGWHTLSIQMPVLDNEAEHAAYAAIYDWVPGRIDAAIDYLRDKGFENIVLIAHSQGATMTAYYLSLEKRPVDGFVAVGMTGGIPGGPMDSLAQLPRLGVPMLDLYGGQDLPEVLSSAEQRASQARKGGFDYTQRQVVAADHFFDGEEAELLAAVREWLGERYEPK